MSQKSNFTIFISCVLVCGLVLGGCGGTPSVVSSPMPIFFQTPPKATAAVPSATETIETTPTFTPKTIIITPDNLFTFPGLKLSNTPDSTDFCEHLPPPQIASNANELSILSGRFSLCPSRSRPSINTAMDLDEGTLVSVENKNADMVMEYAHVPVDGTISYYVKGLNNGHIDEVETNALSYSYCENLLQSLDKGDPGVLIVHEGAIACVLTTKGQIALIRVEHIYPLNTQAVGFSFVILRKE